MPLFLKALVLLPNSIILILKLQWCFNRSLHQIDRKTI
ncbi:hypothetical protein CGLO_13979 [Colletotrichum gloeosporioides Cg-14]|uniref:Uncharacterized protein n=1 Tax=Colletotrichum gloeosporioides (strain Cg-14) TaxID=1237896 RepID=T0JVB0_COLGC|nr:hypothetical protein CGLO_13979 [Colletotrichum gloeosporioides Cg-14]